MDFSYDLLKGRIMALESTFIASPGQLLDGDAINSVLCLTESKIDELDKEFPIFKQCFEIAEKIQPLIAEKRISAKNLSVRVENLLTMQSDFQQTIDYLVNIDALSPLLSSTLLESLDLSTLQTKLSSIDCELQRVKTQSAKQSVELDSLLDAYEKSMTYISDACQKWEAKVKNIERSSIVV